MSSALDRTASRSVAQAYLALLADRGVDYLFGNAGTDFTPIIEAYARTAQSGVAVPRPIVATHENLAVTMAHGYGMVSRRIPAVMAHVSVGTANMICAAMNAARENVAILLTAGRSPLTETGLLGSRDGYIHWAQEMFDQAGMLREIVKWDYELRNAEQLVTVVDRALAIAATEPRGPVYLSLPREVIAAPFSGDTQPAVSRLRPAASAAPDANAIAEAADVLTRAKRPLIVTSNAGRDAAAFVALAEFTERFAIPLAQFRPRYLSLPSSHPMNLGYAPGRLVPNVDAILVIECDVPWIPSLASPGRDCKIIHCGLDPLFSRYPIRNFPSDITITGTTVATLSGLTAALEEQRDAEAVELRRRWIKEERTALTAGWKAALDSAARKHPLDPAWVSHCIEQAKDFKLHRRQRVHPVLRALFLRVSRPLFWIELGVGPRLGRRCRTRRQACETGSAGDGRAWRRRIHVQQSCRRASCGRLARAPRTLRGHEQQHVGSGRTQHARDVSRWTCCEEQRNDFYPARKAACIRRNLQSGRRSW